MIHLRKDRLTAAVGQPAFWALGKGKRKEGKGLVVPGKTKSDAEVAVIRVEVDAVRRTHPPRCTDPRTTARGVLTGRNRTLLLTAIIARIEG